MKRHKKGFSAAQSKLTSRRLRTATLGTHVPRGVRPISNPTNADAVGFSNSRKNRRAAQGLVETLLPASSSGEVAGQSRRRVSQREFTQGLQRKVRFKRLAVLVCAIVLVVGVALGAGALAFIGSLNAKIALGDSTASSALASAKDKTTWYALVVADLGSATSVQKEEGPDALLLVRVDEETPSVSVVSLPPNLQVTLKDGKTHKLREASQQGDAALIAAVAGFAGVDIVHFAKADAQGLSSLVDALGGVSVQVSQEVDDPTAGDVYLSAGKQVLKGDAVLTFLRAKNFDDGVKTQTANQREFFSTLMLQLLSQGDGLGFLMQLDAVGDNFKTDMDAMGIKDLVGKLKNIDPASVSGALVPGYELTRDKVEYFAYTSEAWDDMMKRLEDGQPPAAQADTPVVDPASFTVEVRNGSGITGAAAEMSNMLTAQGFQINATGNMEGTNPYPETLVVYDSPDRLAQAQAVVSALGFGRVVIGNGYYSYDTNVLVILGKDWKPVS